MTTRAPNPVGYFRVRHTQCVHTRAGEGRLRPLRTPSPSRCCRKQRTTGDEPPGPRTGARKAQLRTAGVSAHVAKAKQVAFDQGVEAFGPPTPGSGLTTP